MTKLLRQTYVDFCLNQSETEIELNLCVVDLLTSSLGCNSDVGWLL
jgi:hypothetical protein